MKKSGKAAVCALCAAVALSLAGCAVYGYEADENYPYDVFAQGGYTGTEAEWLSGQENGETVYRRLYEEARADGSFSGTYFEFLKELGISGDSTPYIQRALLSAVSISCRFPAAGTHGTMVTSSGGGVIYRLDKAAGDAYILTNYHVLYSSERGLSTDISVFLYGSELQSEALTARYFGGSLTLDLALLRIENSTLLRESAAEQVTFGDSQSVIAGETVYALGNPMNETLSVCCGVVSVEEEWVSMNAADDATYITLPEIRIDAAINHGNSGGGLFNAAGELVGIVNARDSRDDVVGFGYAIPINFAAAAAQNMLDNGGECRVLNDGIETVVEESKAVYDEALGRTHISEKLCVKDLYVGVASAIYLKKGDTLLSGYYIRNGENVAVTQFTRLGAWSAFLYRARKGDTLVLAVSRQGEPLTLRIVLDKDDHFASQT